MTKLKCLATCYMPSGKTEYPLERYEDIEGEDIYEVEPVRVSEFLATGKFEKA